ncbi:MAG: hypothetical protein AAB966_00860, partial [Patescibacteria group bacterium]
NYFEDLKQHHQTVVFVTHDMNSVRRFCNKAVYIKDGEITMMGSPAEIAERYAEENIGDSKPTGRADDNQPISVKHKITSRLGKFSKGVYPLNIDYSSKDQESLFVGLSIMKDGFSIAEISTEKALKLTGSGELSYDIEVEGLNAGAYSVQANLFKLKNRELVAVTKNSHGFVVVGDDVSRAGALKLADTWKKEI